jgi:hypothetical protein
MSWHVGCKNDVRYVADLLGHDVDTFPSNFGNYNIGAARATNLWNGRRDRLNAADIVITSDTVPLSRIVLQHWDQFEGFLIIWVSNRFDYFDQASNDCGFPDPAFYDLIRRFSNHERVRIVSYTPIEPVYAKELKKVDFGDLLIRPSGMNPPTEANWKSAVPASVDKPNSFFIPKYHNDTIYMNLPEKCRSLGLPNFCGRYAGPRDLVDFKAIIHIPYAWSIFAFFENLVNGLPYLVPSTKFLFKLAETGNFWFQDRSLMKRYIHLSELYHEDHKGAIVYFDSWEDLKEKAKSGLPSKEKVAEIGKRHSEEMIRRWRKLYEEVGRVQRVS